MRFKYLLVLIIGMLAASTTYAQNPADKSKWTFQAKRVKGEKDKYRITIHLHLPEGWHIYSMKPGGDGMEIAPEFKFSKNSLVLLQGDVQEKGKLISEKLDGVDGIVNMYKGDVDYAQDAIISGNTTIKGTYMYQICNDQMCLPPPTKSFSIEITDNVAAPVTISKLLDSPATDTSKKADTALARTTPTKDTAAKAVVASATTGKPKIATKNSIEEQSLIMVFLLALGGGIAAVFTPCIFSMIPITVSFFTKRSKTRKEGIKNAFYYSASIIFIFTILGVLISAVFGSAALNTLSTNWVANLFFFVIFVIFGISFLGAFEITLPSSWTNATDSRASTSSLGGIFFMALTLVIVSFSCTGPIVGPLLVLAGKGGIVGPAIGMFGFSLGLALPFALFAIFPGWLNHLATSGGWLNQVKVVLGFIELALALKFLSNADLAQGWRLLDREIFVAIWIVLSILLGLYLLDKIKFSHDDATPKNVYGQEYVSIFKLLLAIVIFTFAVYLLPGMWGAPLNAVSAFVPPMGTFSAFTSGGGEAPQAAVRNSEMKPERYASELRIYEPPVVKNLGLVTYYDYDEALAASKKFKKPVMLDFTGINCVNCRKMESQVWSKPEVAKILKEDFIVVSLYCDMNRIELPKNEQFFSKDLNSQVVTLGNKNADLQASKYGAFSQPYYFYVDENGNKLAEEGYAYDPDISKFVAHLDSVKSRYHRLHP